MSSSERGRARSRFRGWQRKAGMSRVWERSGEECFTYRRLSCGNDVIRKRVVTEKWRRLEGPATKTHQSLGLRV